jgi:hypothetical protein
MDYKSAQVRSFMDFVAALSCKTTRNILAVAGENFMVFVGPVDSRLDKIQSRRSE